MKILIFNWRCWKNPLAGGSEKYLYEISTRLSKKGHIITWFVSDFKGAKEKEFDNGIEIIRKGGRFSIYLYAFWCYITKLRKRDFDFVVDNINGVPFFTPLYIWKSKVAIVHHLVGWKIFSNELSLPQAVLAWSAERLIPLIYFFTPFITVSESSKKELDRNLIRKVSVIPNGVDISIKNYNPDQKSKKPAVLYLGRWKKYKRINLLLESFEIVKKRIKNAELWLAGSRDSYFKKNINGMKFFGNVCEKKKIGLLTGAWVLVMPSEKEGWGISVIEANACGTPAIAYDVPGLRDSILDAKTGILVKEDGDVKKLAGAIIKILEDEGLRKKLSKNALEWSTKFTWDKSAREFERLIEAVINE